MRAFVATFKDQYVQEIRFTFFIKIEVKDILYSMTLLKLNFLQEVLYNLQICRII